MRSLLLAALMIFAVTHRAPADDKSDTLSKNGPLPLKTPFDEAQAKAAQVAWAKSLGKPSPVEKNSIGMELVLIPPGKFTMGSPASEQNRSADETQVDVTLTKSFSLGKTEVTQGQWRAVMGTTPWTGKEKVREGDNFPVTYVNWEDAIAFCKTLSAKENVAYRLPTEAEWEYACRAGTTTQFSFGDNESSLSSYAWWGNLSGDGNAKEEKYVHEVGRKRSNPFGLHDMHGNVWEWCEDLYACQLPGGTDPLVAEGSVWELRGGSWNSDAAFCRSASRNWSSPAYRNFSLGFRVARSSGQ